MTNSQFCSNLVKNHHCYATHSNDVGETATLFRIPLKPNANIQNQRPTKSSIYHRDKLK